MPYVEGARNMCSVQEVTQILPIAGADRIELAKVLGWQVVVRKGVFKVGQKVAYFEVDTLCPDDNPIFGHLQGRGQKTVFKDGKEITGHVLRTIKLRGEISQGMLMPLAELGIQEHDVEVGTDISELAGVLKYEDELPFSGGDIVGRFNTLYCPKSDAERLQNLSKYWDEIKSLEWQPTVKVDGTSRTLVKDTDGTLHIYSRNYELKYDNNDLGVVVAKKWNLEDALAPGEAIQFELVGPGIQKNRLHINEPRPFVFSYWRNGNKVSPNNWSPMLRKAGVPFLDKDLWKPEGSLEEFIDKVSKNLRGNITKDLPDEGIVFHLLSSEMPSFLDRTLCFKVISNKYLIKHGI